MNKHDRENLNFLLSIDATTLHHWYTNSSADDIAYAEELLNAFQLELDAKAKELLVETKLNSLNQYPEANAILSKFQLH